MMNSIISYLQLMLLLIFANTLPLTTANRTFEVPLHLDGNNETVFNILSTIEDIYKPIDLGIGSPDMLPLDTLQAGLAEAIYGDFTISQYTDKNGKPRLRKALAKFYSKIINRELDPDKNIYVTIGATQAIFLTIASHTSLGDEWIIIEPYYSNYAPSVKAARGTPRFVTLKPNKTCGEIRSSDWTFDRTELENAFNNKTKGILINNPHNPTGKVYTREELQFIADLAKKWDTLVLSDEVYEFLMYDNKEHVRIATLDGMFDRTITISSGSKTFTATGYRVGWLYGGAKIVKNLDFLQAQMIDSSFVPAQEAFAVTIEKEILDYGKPDSWLNIFRREGEMKRNILVKMLKYLGMNPVIPDAGFFVTANITSLDCIINYNNEMGEYKDHKFAKWLIRNVGVLGFPLSSFYSTEHKKIGEEGMRFTFLKTAKVLHDAYSKIKEWKTNHL